MEWMTHLADGSQYGPLNLLAVRHFIESEMIPPDAKLTNKLTNQTVSSDILLTPEMASVGTELARVRRDNRALIKQSDELRGECDRLRAKQAEYEKALQEAKAADPFA